ncbi:MAG: hypothetical protein P8N76_16930 [Pirellulaceae bacterium]|nr:hypothetical protein [Pirellulaceae bacterium]
MPRPWQAIELDADRNASETRDAAIAPLAALISGDIPAIVVRHAFPQSDCQHLIQRLIAHQLMFESQDERIQQTALSSSQSDRWTRTGSNPTASSHRRIDIGTSLGNHGDDREEFFRRAAETHQLFDELFSAPPNPIQLVYQWLQRLTPNKRVITAIESDGRQYGPAIFRVHYGGYTYPPHFDSVRNREARTDYSIYRFDHQLAGVLCLQNTVRDGQVAQGVVYQQAWEPRLDPYLKNNRFHDFVKQNDIPRCLVELEPGDLYFFNTGMIHEVPGVDGSLPRVVLATFIGYSDDEPDVMVWS